MMEPIGTSTLTSWFWPFYVGNWAGTHLKLMIPFFIDRAVAHAMGDFIGTNQFSKTLFG